MGLLSQVTKTKGQQDERANFNHIEDKNRFKNRIWVHKSTLDFTKLIICLLNVTVTMYLQCDLPSVKFYLRHDLTSSTCKLY